MKKGISLIALIITIIVIIILAAIVIGAVMNAPDKANFAKYCQDYSEIQTAVSTQATILYGKKVVSGGTDVANYTMADAYRELCGGENIDMDNENYIKISPQQATKTENGLGLSSLPEYVEWYVNTSTGEVVTTKFSYNEIDYNTPNGTKKFKIKENEETFDELLVGSKWHINKDGMTLTKGNVTVSIGDYVDYTYDKAEDYTTLGSEGGFATYKISQTPSLKWKIVGIDNEGRLELMNEPQLDFSMRN